MFRAIENPSLCWRQVGFAYKTYFIIIIALFVLSLFSVLNPFFLIDSPILTVGSFQIWRLLFPYLVYPPYLGFVLSILFGLLWITKFFKEERQKSTPYMLLEPFIFNLEIHLTFNLLALPLISLIFFFKDSSFSDLNSMFMIGFGLFNLIIVYQFGVAARDPQGQSQFCCLPFLIKNKYFPWVISIFLFLVSQQRLCVVSAILVGFYQECIRKSNIIKFPYSVYRVLDQYLSKLVQNREDYTPISHAQDFVRKNSCGAPRSRFQSQARPPPRIEHPSSPAEERVNNEASSKIEVGGGVKIDSSSGVKNFKNHWAMKDQASDSNYRQKKSLLQDGQNLDLNPQADQEPKKKPKNEDNSQAQKSNEGEISCQALLKKGNIADEDLL